mmetsp:Transcript_54010/g.96726  ORF Transcript_54010/g.96726 Transcript_54010/m.96726 type:complete len:211 (-) Transcript_54010:105-737(-)
MRVFDFRFCIVVQLCQKARLLRIFRTWLCFGGIVFLSRIQGIHIKLGSWDIICGSHGHHMTLGSWQILYNGFFCSSCHGLRFCGFRLGFWLLGLRLGSLSFQLLGSSLLRQLFLLCHLGRQLLFRKLGRLSLQSLLLLLPSLQSLDFCGDAPRCFARLGVTDGLLDKGLSILRGTRQTDRVPRAGLRMHTNPVDVNLEIARLATGAEYRY